MKCRQEWSKAKVMLEVFFQQPQYKQRNSVPKDLQLTRKQYVRQLRCLWKATC